MSSWSGRCGTYGLDLFCTLKTESTPLGTSIQPLHLAGVNNKLSCDNDCVDDCGNVSNDDCGDDFGDDCGDDCSSLWPLNLPQQQWPTYSVAEFKKKFF